MCLLPNPYPVPMESLGSPWESLGLSRDSWVSVMYWWSGPMSGPQLAHHLFLIKIIQFRTWLIDSEWNHCQNLNSPGFWAKQKDQKIYWQHILIIIPIILRQDYLILVLSLLQCMNNCQNQVWSTIIYRGKIVEPKFDHVPYRKYEYVFSFCLR